MTTKKTHVGNGGTAYCATGMSASRVSRARPAMTVTLERFLTLPREQQCERCRRKAEPGTDAASAGQRADQT